MRNYRIPRLKPWELSTDMESVVKNIGESVRTVVMENDGEVRFYQITQEIRKDKLYVVATKHGKIGRKGVRRIIAKGLCDSTADSKVNHLVSVKEGERYRVNYPRLKPWACSKLLLSYDGNAEALPSLGRLTFALKFLY